MRRTRRERFRLGTVFAAVCLLFAAVLARLVHLQVFCHPEYRAIVEDQSSAKVEIPAARGVICDRAGRIVANNVEQASLYAYPLSKREVDAVGRYLEDLFRLRRGTAVSRYRLAPKRFRYIKRRMDDALAAEVEANAPHGLHLRTETQRVYPYALVGRQVLGFTDIDNKGQAGVEHYYDSVLAGKTGLADVYRDGLRNCFRVKEQALVRPRPGRSVVLTLDWRLQEIVEEALKAATEKHNARSAMAAFLDCRTGDVLAMAHYDPKEENPEKPVKLRTVTDQFEPGSVFKVVTAAGLLDCDVVDFDDSVFCENGKWRIGRRWLHDDKEHGWLSFRRTMELSSNIGIAKYAIDLGGEQLFATAKDFGAGERLHIGLPGETAGCLIVPERWSEYTIASLAMGHAVAVSALQMAVIVGAIANGGELLQPRLVLAHIDENGALEPQAGRKVTRRVMRPASADSLRAIMRGVVESGTAEAVISPAVAIAGKTGTAQIPDLENRGYYPNRFTASFAGFFPYEDPLVAGVVVLEDPQPVHYGGLTAGPAFRIIAERYSVLNPDLFATAVNTLKERHAEIQQAMEVPSLVGRLCSEATAIAAGHGVRVRANSPEGIVEWQFPPAGRIMMKNDEIIVVVRVPQEDGYRMADLKGLSVREAAAFLDRIGVRCQVRGSGRVVGQSIAPGELLKANPACQLRCRAT